MRSIALPVLLLAGVGFAGWHYQERIMAFTASLSSAAHLSSAQPSSAQPAEKPDVLYRWVDKEGITHFDQQAGKGRAIIYDGSRITPMGKVDASAPDSALKSDEKPEKSSTNPVVTMRQDALNKAQIMREEWNKQSGH